MIHPIKRLGDRPPIDVEIPDDTPADEQLRVAVVAAVQRGIHLDHASLDGASLYGASLDGASLYGASLVGARLYGASLDGASLDGASLDGARLDGASLDGASLYYARLDGARLDGASLDGASLDGALLVGHRPILQIGPVGSRNGTMVLYRAVDGLHVATGCFRGTVEEFLSRVRDTHGDNQHARDYFAAIEFARVLLPPATPKAIAVAEAAEARVKKMLAGRAADAVARECGNK